MSPPSYIPKGFRRRIRSDCRELAIVRVLLQANTPLTAGDIGKQIGLTANDVSSLLQVHVGTGAVLATKMEVPSGYRQHLYELAPCVRAAVAAEVGA